MPVILACMGEGAKKHTGAEVVPFTQSGELLRNVMDHAAVGMALAGADGHLLYANPAFREILGYDESDISRLTAADIGPADPVSAPAIEFERLRAGTIESFREECQYCRKDGTLTWVLLSASVMRGEQTGAPLHIILQLVDIDRRKRAEAALTYSENRWNAALEAAGQGVWDHDIRADEMFYSPMWKIMRGYTPDEEVDDAQDAWLARLHPDDRERIRAIIDKQDTGEDGYDTIEYRERRKDGRYVWIHSRGRPIEWGPDGKPVRTVGTDTDITRQKQIEAQLSAEKERLRVTLQSIGEGVISTDEHTRIIFMNAMAETMTGWSAEAAIGKPVDTVFLSRNPDNDTEPVDAVGTCLRSGLACRPEEYSLMVSDGGVRRFVRESAAPVRTEKGDLIGAVMVFQDRTARRKMEEELAYAATHDSLTRLPNRMAFDRAFEETVAHVKTGAHGGALCLIDLDYFKQVNDAAGHAAGDALLKRVAGSIRSCCRTGDFAARIGGDEFAVILKHCPAEGARRVAQKVVDTIGDLHFDWNESVHTIAASIGIAEITSDAASADELYRHADAACYAAKSEGRNCVVAYAEIAATNG